MLELKRGEGQGEGLIIHEDGHGHEEKGTARRRQKQVDYANADVEMIVARKSTLQVPVLGAEVDVGEYGNAEYEGGSASADEVGEGMEIGAVKL